MFRTFRTSLLAAVLAAGCADQPTATATGVAALVGQAPVHPCARQLGAKPWHGALDGFNPCTGNLAIAIAVGPIEIVHNSLDSASAGPAGWGTRLGVRDQLVLDADGSVTRVLPDGERVLYAAGPAGDLVAPPEATGTLRAIAGGYELREQGGTLRRYGRPDGQTWLLVAVTDRNGNATTITYDAAGREQQLVSSFGTATSLSWDGARLAAVTDGEGLRWQLGYGPAGDLIEVRGPAGTTGESFAYDSDHRLVERRSASGAMTARYGYQVDGSVASWVDASGRATVVSTYPLQVRLRDGFGATSTYDYSPAGELAQVTDPTGVATLGYGYDALHRVTVVRDWLAGETRYGYDATHALAQQTDRYGQVTRYTYDARRNPLTVTDPTGRVTRYTYDAFDQVTSAIDPSGRPTSYVRDARGNLLQVIASDGTVVAGYAYGPRGEVVRELDRDGRETLYTYDAHLNLTSRREPDGTLTRYAASPLGRPLSETSPAGEIRTYAYDAAHRPLGVQYENGGEVTVDRDVDGRVIGVIDDSGPEPQIWSGAYTDDGRLATSVRNGVPELAAPATLAVPPPAAPPTCEPATCDGSYAGACGTVADGCGGILSCPCADGTGAGSAPPPTAPPPPAPPPAAPPPGTGPGSMPPS